MGVVQIAGKLWKSDDLHKSRFHDARGELATFGDALWLPRRLVENVLRRRGILSPVPWWPPRATTAIGDILQPDWTVMEFGSGMSSTWLARRVARVTSVEHDKEWAARVRRDAERDKVSNLIVLDRDRAGLLNVPSGPYDLVVVDSIRRADCVRWAMKNTKPGGFTYLDNSDLDRDAGGEGVDNLARHLLEYAAHDGLGNIAFLRGYPPAQLAPCEGALFRHSA